jgi:hypothetical protein
MYTGSSLIIKKLKVESLDASINKLVFDTKTFSNNLKDDDTTSSVIGEISVTSSGNYDIVSTILILPNTTQVLLSYSASLTQGISMPITSQLNISGIKQGQKIFESVPYIVYITFNTTLIQGNTYNLEFSVTTDTSNVLMNITSNITHSSNIPTLPHGVQ